jgi:hypothetical protein
VEIVRDDKPAELVSVTPWLQFINTIAEPGINEPLAALMRGEARRLMLFGSAGLISASEPSLDLLRALIVTLSGRYGGGLDDDLPRPAIRMHPMMHYVDSRRVLKKAESEPDTAFFILVADATLYDPAWAVVPLANTALLPQPALALVKFLHRNWQLSDMNPMLDVLERWACAQLGNTRPDLKVIT